MNYKVVFWFVLFIANTKALFCPKGICDSDDVLWAAIEVNDVRAAIYAIRSGASVNLKNESDDSVLHWAAAEGHASIIRLVIAKGAAVNVYNVAGLTPLDLAMILHRWRIVWDLVNAGALISDEDYNLLLQGKTFKSKVLRCGINIKKKHPVSVTH
jgi:ankyrin repeat protein